MKACIYSLGCRVNIYESEYVEALLKSNGFEIVDFNSGDASIYIINTCSVTNEADRKSRQIINRAKRNNPDAIVVVMGCYSQVNSDKIDADIVIGNKDKSKIVKLINEAIESKRKIKKIYNLRDEAIFEDMSISRFDNHTRAFVKIQDGCNAFCSYCIIPYTRGRIRSKKEDDVVKEVTNLVNNGYKEIVLTGIHTGKYGMDLENTNLEKLLRRLVKIEGLYRLRLSSIEINEVTDGILDILKNNKVMASHFHIPIQSGSDKILKSMNRCYDVDYFIKRINKIRSVRNDMSITTDLIVGFPGESDEDFNITLNTLDKIGFTKIHVFPYSKRDNTKASEMPNQIDNNIKKKRVRVVLDKSLEYENTYYKKFIGGGREGVGGGREGGKVIVHTSNFIPVNITCDVDNNIIVKVKIVSVDNDNVVYGEVV